MRSSTTLVTSALAALASFGLVIAQTPAGFSPATNASAPARFGANSYVLAGNAVPLDQTAVSPAIDLLSTPKYAHIVMMVDLDAPGGINNNSYAPFLHWLTPVPAATYNLTTNQTGLDPIAPYVGPQPPVGTGKHRYVLLVLECPNSTFVPPPGFTFNSSDISQRIVFNVSGFISGGGYKVIGANWFTTENKTETPVQSGAVPRLGSPHIGAGLGWLAMAIAAFVYF